jgi:hypothetical protein
MSESLEASPRRWSSNHVPYDSTNKPNKPETNIPRKKKDSRPREPKIGDSRRPDQSLKCREFKESRRNLKAERIGCLFGRVWLKIKEFG